MKASFNGDISEIPGIAVDNFENTEKRAYFLSHCHGDHVTGLNTLYQFIRSKSVFIYMSEISAAIVLDTIDMRLKDCIKTLKIGKCLELTYLFDDLLSVGGLCVTLTSPTSNP